MQLSLLELLFPKKPAAPPGPPLTRDDVGSYIPGVASEYIQRWFQNNPVRLRIVSARTSKFGDYRPPKDTVPATITINNNLNPYDFLITLVHEIAHDLVMGNYEREKATGFRRPRRRRPKPHGKEWQDTFRGLMIPLMNPGVFPEDVLSALEAYFSVSVPATKSNQALALALKKYDIPDGSELLQDLPHDTVFYLPSGRAFRKKEKVRKRFRCISLSNRRIYLFNPLSPVSRDKP
jgi:SprT protein